LEHTVGGGGELEGGTAFCVEGTVGMNSIKNLAEFVERDQRNLTINSRRVILSEKMT
jgi:hypothetical protein